MIAAAAVGGAGERGGAGRRPLVSELYMVGERESCSETTEPGHVNNFPHECACTGKFKQQQDT